jgi:hypothetical protein
VSLLKKKLSVKLKNYYYFFKKKEKRKKKNRKRNGVAKVGVAYFLFIYLLRATPVIILFYVTY